MRFVSSRVSSAVIVTIIGVLFWMAIGSNVIGMAFHRDFLNLYTGGLLARTGHLHDLYNFELQAATQDALVGKLPIHFPFVRPSFYAVLLTPISLVPVRVAFPIWILLQVAGMALAWVWAWRRFGPDSMIYCALFLPTSLGIAHGQDCIVLLLIMLATWTLMERKREALAGLVLSLSLFKFHLFLLLPLAILLRRRWSLFRGYAAGGVALALVSMLVSGVEGVRGYVALLERKDIEALSPSPEMMIGVNSIAVNLGLDYLWLKALLGAAVVALVVWSAVKAQEDVRWFWTAVFGSMMLSPHTYEYDLSSLLIPALIAVFTLPGRAMRVAAATALIPLPYFFTIAGAPWAILPSLVLVALMVNLSGLVPPAVAAAACPPEMRNSRPEADVT